eukprot:CAMPEP_0197829986 /NCGR_PEP_ID=MMETSP1437-20131217/6544_1 /TAXON_ID=49252 ORGANISM="Eucampia antarctica, Strain CCMP1452" /NCGR_SAMPLE_ID=MMETSP1437 /ASSEMBLY_ACC=CAM_ASM_001096 /LENGTH=74 /DNA_ID=CAMNT_0043432041 /DNA_START=23 /DNA_END=247 /DNA_ORIENTATION=+
MSQVEEEVKSKGKSEAHYSESEYDAYDDFTIGKESCNVNNGVSKLQKPKKQELKQNIYSSKHVRAKVSSAKGRK